MTWLEALKAYFQLCAGIFLFGLLMHTCARQWGLSQNYQRLAGSVLEKSNDFIYLTNNSQGQTKFKTISSKKQPLSTPNSKNAPFQTQSHSNPLFPQSMTYIELHKISDLPRTKRQDCVFVSIHFISEDYSKYQPLLKFLGNNPCTFIQSPYSQILEFFSSQKPRWLYGLPHKSLVRAQFLTALGLEPIASLKGDFIYTSFSALNISPRLIRELKRRHFVFFIDERPELNPLTN